MKYLINFHKPKCKSPLGLSRPILFAEFKEKKVCYFHGFLESLSLHPKTFVAIVWSLCQRELV